MIRIVSAFVVCALPLMLLGCADTTGRPNVDGYTLHGLVLDADTGAPLEGASIRVGFEPSPEFHHFAVTDANGAFLFQPSPATAPNIEVFRFEKTGYTSLDVPARTAIRLEEGRYRLEAHLEPVAIR